MNSFSFRRAIEGALPILLVMALAAGLRLYHLGAQSLWGDEMFSLTTATGKFPALHLAEGTAIPKPLAFTQKTGGRPWWTAWSNLEQDSHPPLYFLLLRVWCDAFGQGEASVRGISVVASVLAVGALYAAVATAAGRTAGIWAAMLLALSGPQIRYAQEARDYALGVLAATLGGWAMARVARFGIRPRRLAALSLCTFLMLFCHYYTVGVVVGLAVYAGVAFVEKQRLQLLAAIAVGVALFGVVWGPELLQQRRMVADNDWARDDRPDHVGLVVERAAELPGRLLAEHMGGELGVIYLDKTDIDFAVTWLPSLVIVLALFDAARRRRTWLWLLCFLAAVSLPVGVDLLHGLRQTSMIRYSLFAGPAMAALAGILSTTGRGRWLIPAACVLLCVWRLPCAYVAKPAWRPAIERLQSQLDSSALIMISTPSEPSWYAWTVLVPVMHYLSEGTANTVIIASRQPEPALLEQMRRSGNVYLICHRASPPPTQWIPGAEIVEQWRAGTDELIYRVKIGR